MLFRSLLADRYIHLYGAASGQWTDVPQIECVAVGVCVAVVAIKCEFDPGVCTHGSVDRFQPKAEILKRRRLQQGEIQIFRKTIVAEVAAFERRPSLEGELASETTPLQGTEQPGDTIVPLQDALRNTAASRSGEPICQQRNVPLWNQNQVLRIASSSAEATFKRRRHFATRGPSFGMIGSSSE